MPARMLLNSDDDGEWLHKRYEVDGGRSPGKGTSPTAPHAAP